MLDSVDGDFFDDEMDGGPLFVERLRRDRLGVVADIGELEAAAAGGSITMGGSLRGGFASESFLAVGLVSFIRLLFGSLNGADADTSFAGPPVAADESVLGRDSLVCIPFGLGALSSERDGMGPLALPPPRPARPPLPPPLPGRPLPPPRKADPASPLRPHCLLGGWPAHMEAPTPPDGVEGEAAEAIRIKH